MAIKLAIKVSKINKELTSFSKTKILKTLKISAKAIKNKKNFKKLIKKICDSHMKYLYQKPLQYYKT